MADAQRCAGLAKRGLGDAVAVATTDSGTRAGVEGVAGEKLDSNVPRCRNCRPCKPMARSEE
jgi:hypothetical protein